MTGEEQVRRRLAELAPVSAPDADGRPADDARADGPPHGAAARDGTVRSAVGADHRPDGGTRGEGPVAGALENPAGNRSGAVDAHGLRRRALAAAASTYALTYGHPLAHDGHDGHGKVRWGTSARVAGAAAGALALLTIVVVVRALAAAPATVVVPTTPPVLTSVERAAGPSAAPGPGSAPGSAGQAPTSGGPPERDDGVVVVHVVGAVRSPGVVTLPADARVVDAVDRAGGATDQADLAGVNLARTVVDGEQIAVPGVGASPRGSGDPGPAGPATAAGPSAGQAGGGDATQGLDVNTASAVELEALPGIGPVLAQRIVDHRATFGPFATVEDLAAVSGIGPAVLARLAGEVRVG
ncbi:ComEA family DNA-binding protein [Cellulomonas carbonis]|uniref:ComEA family DNA-binding protein n=1 Tax=Cellulomonas carbonis TaxID=1386092 RepID=UPI001E4EB727|nr:ComEA family DNA-binding protein [Cellulomonas carbonis]